MDLRAISLQTIKTVTAKKFEQLEALGLHSVHDLLHHFPFRHEDQTVKSLFFATDGEKITVLAQVVGAPDIRYIKGGKTMLRCRMEVDGAFISAVWFNRTFVKDHLIMGREFLLSGKWDAKFRQINVAEHSVMNANGPTANSGLTPVYSTVATLPQKWLRTLIETVTEQYADLIEDTLPEELRTRHQLPTISQAVRQVHKPDDTQTLAEARKRLIYEEFFFYQLRMQAFRALNKRKHDGIAHVFTGESLRSFKDSLPFSLTAAQNRVLREIMTDLRQPFAMNRLLQGDVGAGKTIVAAFAMFAVVQAGAQAVLMVPTEILAEQHYRSLHKLLEPFGITIYLLTGSTTERNRRQILGDLRLGLVDMVVGTHALIQDQVLFKKLGLIVTDEQHRFGVNQRAVLRGKGLNPDVLSMTATPIPRTLAITAFGDLDVSILDELPKGRLPIVTSWVKSKQFSAVKQQLFTELGTGRQAYLICPLIEESDKLDVQNAIDMYETLVAEWSQIKIGLLHGKMSNADKDDVMRDFKNNLIQLLVSTTVVEVGVDVPNATFMVIYDADRFGLSQLHQLRGRVGRGSNQSYCILIADPSSDFGVQRMNIMCATNDGFEISRKDLELRGAGDFFGTKQSGAPEFRMGDMLEDFAMLEQTRNDVAELLAEESFWTSHHYLSLRQYLQNLQMFAGTQLD